MEFIKLDKKEQFDNLKKGDIIIVKWKRGATEYKRTGSITHHNVKRIIEHPPIGEGNPYTEVILNTRQNTYFNVQMYLQGKSFAEEVYLVK